MTRLIIISAPSGAGKSTIINYLLEQNLGLEFSISATCRPPRGEEQHGREYYFLSVEEFKNKIENDEFLEYEEVYQDRFYGTLKSEVDRISAEGKFPIFDVDVVGGCNIKDYYGDKALSIFIQPPSIAELKLRLEKRATDSPEVIMHRVEKAVHELAYASRFDVIIVNDDLEKAKKETLEIVKTFLHQ